MRARKNKSSLLLLLLLPLLLLPLLLLLLPLLLLLLLPPRPPTFQCRRLWRVLHRCNPLLRHASVGTSLAGIRSLVARVFLQRRGLQVHPLPTAS